MKIAVIKQGALGDLISLSAFLIPIKESHPNAEITIFASKYFLKVYPEKILYEHFYCYDKHTYTWIDYVKAILFLRKEKFDFIFQLRYGSEIDDFVAVFGGAKKSVGFKKSFFSTYFTNKVIFGDKLKHEYLRIIDALKVINIHPEKLKTSIYKSAEDEKYIHKFLLQNNLKSNKFILIAPTASSFSKEWLPDRFVTLSKLLIHHLGLQIVVDNGLGKNDLPSKMVFEIGEGAILSPPTTIHQFGELIRQSAICVCNNSAAMNIAFAVDTITVAISSLPPDFWGALGENDVTIYPFENTLQWNNYAINANDIQRKEILGKIFPKEVYEIIIKKLHFFIH